MGPQPPSIERLAKGNGTMTAGSTMSVERSLRRGRRHQAADHEILERVINSPGVDGPKIDQNPQRIGRWDTAPHDDAQIGQVGWAMDDHPGPFR